MGRGATGYEDLREVEGEGGERGREKQVEEGKKEMGKGDKGEW